MQTNLPQRTGTKVSTNWNSLISNGKISTKWHDKLEDFSLFTVCMPNFHSNIPSTALMELLFLRSFVMKIIFFCYKSLWKT